LAIVTLALAIACHRSGAAAGINLSWTDCYGGPGTSLDQNFACDVNDGSHVLVATFDPPQGVTRLVGLSAVIDVATADAMPSWWQLAAGGCRAGSLQLDIGNAEIPFCTTYWPLITSRSLAYTTNAGGYANRTRIHVSMGIPEDIAGAVDSGTEYYAFRLLLDNAATIGGGACEGCDIPACIILTALWLYQPPAFGDHAICSPLLSNFVTWQGGPVGQCPGTDTPPPWWPTDCLTTPAQNRTWGQIKSLYR
jgi:hypothetical protein